jgi:uncharacterized protein YjbI with pentapeptide repeats
VDQEQPSKQIAGDRLLKRLGIDPGEWTLGERCIVLLAIGIGLVIVITAVCGYVFTEWEWTGLTRPRLRTFWDWLDLLIVPIVLALGGYLFTRSENRRTQQTAEQRAQTDRQIEEQRAQESALQAYLEQMTQLVRGGLRDQEWLSSLRLLVRGRTLSLFWQLDPKRKRRLLQILHEADLIGTETRVIGLSGADLREAYLRELDLKNAALNGADMKCADLEWADLRGADLSGADLSNANLSNADLTGATVAQKQLDQAKCLEGVAMPNGQMYEDWLNEKVGRGEDEADSGNS